MTKQHTPDSQKPTYGDLLKRIEELEAEKTKKNGNLEYEDKYHFLFDNLQETVVVYKVVRDEKGEIVDWILDDCNILARKNLGRPFEEAKGKRATELFGKEMVSEYIERSRSVDKTRSVETFETYFDFNKRYYSSKVFFITDDLYVSVSEDITDRVYAEKESETLRNQLIQAQKMEAIGNLAGGIAHDFNNILTSIIGFTELALDDVEKGTEVADNLLEVYSAGKRAKDLVKQILAFARQSKEELKPVNIRKIIEEQIKFIRSSLPTIISIKSDINSDAQVLGNPTQIHQVIMNLCTNAAHSMENKLGELSIRLNNITFDTRTEAGNLRLNPGKYIEIEISDTGSGISPDIIDSIFDPYFTTKAPGEGTGMGLSMVKGIAESYGGGIAVESRVGIGTTFTVYLPVTETRETAVSYERRKLPTGGERILLVDDEPAIVKMNDQILTKLGYEVTWATAPTEALEKFQSMPDAFDLVISDMTMPKMTGLMLAEEILKIRPDIHVVLCTGYSKILTETEALNTGIKAVLHKPVIKSVLARTIRNVIDGCYDHSTQEDSGGPT